MAKTDVTTTANSPGEIMEKVIAGGDLSKLSPEQRTQYYTRVCESIGLNPLTQPFQYITLNGKLVLYATRSCTDQLRSIKDVSVDELSAVIRDGVIVVTAKVRDAKGRTDISRGAVALGTLKGEALANAIMKAETKAKRRATLSICGLGWMDETEVETVPGARREPEIDREVTTQTPPSPRQVETPPPPAHDPDTGEIGPRTIPVPAKANKQNWIAFGQAYIAGVKSSETLADVDEWQRLNYAALERMEKAEQQVFDRLRHALQVWQGEKFPAADDTDPFAAGAEGDVI